MTTYLPNVVLYTTCHPIYYTSPYIPDVTTCNTRLLTYNTSVNVTHVILHTTLQSINYTSHYIPNVTL